MIGMTSENGPFIFPPQSKKMVINDHAWNMNAHVIYLESPAGVGFSKGKN
jgi:carboxypeptidase C (cathepsin A)